MSATAMALVVVMLILLLGGMSFMRNRMPVRGGLLTALSVMTLIGLLKPMVG